MGEKIIDIKLLIIKSLSNELTMEESLSVLNWMNESEENIKLYAKIKDVHTLLEIEDIRDKHNNKHKSKKLFFRRLATVGSVAAMLTIGFFVSHLYVNRDNFESIIPKNIAENRVTIISNGGQYEVPDSLQDLKVHASTLVKAVKNDPKKSSIEINKICVPSGKTFKTILEDGTEVHLNANSTLIFPSSFEKGKRTVELIGEGYFSVKKESREFIVVTKNSNIKVLGTQFNVHCYNSDDKESISLVEGSVEVYKLSDKESVRLVPGKRAVINVNRPGIELSNFRTEEILAWKNGEFMFDDKPLVDVLGEVERWYNVKFEFTFESLKNYVTYLKVKKEKPIEELLKAISATNHVNFNVLGDKIYVVPKIR